MRKILSYGCLVTGLVWEAYRLDLWAFLFFLGLLTLTLSDNAS